MSQTDTENDAQKKRQAKPQWFGSTLTEATEATSSIPYQPFPSSLRDRIQPHIAKATQRRSEALLAIQRATDKHLSATEGYTQHKDESSIYKQAMEEFLASALAQEASFAFDISRYPLREAFRKSCGLPEGLDLSQIHQSERSIQKLEMFQNLTKNPDPLQSVYDNFVRQICCPKLAELYNCQGEIYYQCFPCIRVVEPRDFSIGPHADVSYGHHPFTANFYVLLTDLSEQESSAALFLESKPGVEDWHPILGKYGEMVKHFPGAICAHWTTENNTTITRVSLDFRLIPGPLFRILEDGGKENGGQSDVYRQTEGYYNHCRFVGGDTGESQWERTGPLCPPDARVGFPWTVSNWGKLLAKKERERSKQT